MKTCFRCGLERPIEDFYRHSQMADGRLNKCKTCTRADVVANRAAKVEYYRNYDRERATLPHRMEAGRAYSITAAGRTSRRAANERYLRADPRKRVAHSAVSNAIRDGRLVKQACEVCGDLKAEAHHDDYSRPLEVRWLCGRDHAAHHRQLRCA